MATTAYVTVSNLGTFKTKQDAYNLEHFASLSGGKVSAEQLPSYVDDVIEGYMTLDGSTLKLYKEAAHTTEIAGETGKIYTDLGTSPSKVYRWTGSAFVEIAAAPGYASTSDYGIVKIGDNIEVEGGVISIPAASGSALGVAKNGSNISNTNGEFYIEVATGSVLGVAKAGTNVSVESGAFNVLTGGSANLGVLKVGANISVNEGTISIGSSDIVNALGFTPSEQMEMATGSDIEALFS